MADPLSDALAAVLEVAMVELTTKEQCGVLAWLAHDHMYAGRVTKAAECMKQIFDLCPKTKAMDDAIKEALNGHES